MLTFSVVLIHEDAHLHTASHTQTLLEHFTWEFDQPPYICDLAPSNYHLFTYMKNCLLSQCFNNDDELMEGELTGGIFL
jgi:hypothetical protein